MSHGFALLLIVSSILFQIFLLVMFWRRNANLHYGRFKRLINPASWIAGFYSLWFLLPQITGLSYDLHILGFESDYVTERRHAYLLTQSYLMVFLLALNAAIFVPIKVRRPPAAAVNIRRAVEIIKHYESSRYLFYLLLLVGLIGSSYVAFMNLGNLDGFRSQIVKTPAGKLATAMQLMGAFALSSVGVCLYLKRQYVPLILLLAVFGAVYMFTGARGRLLWPIAIMFMYLIAIQGGQIKLKHGLLAVLGLGLLLALDPLVKYVKTGDVGLQSSADFLAPLLFKRNFDGFGNFAYLLYYDLVPPSPSFLLSGARDEFMTTYFPVIWEMGVGWGTTTPGLLFLSSYNLLMFFLLSMAFGATLVLINLWLRANTHVMMLWAYLFAMPWYCALGGNLIESLDKMLVAASGPILIFAFERFTNRQFR